MSHKIDEKVGSYRVTTKETIVHSDVNVAMDSESVAVYVEVYAVACVPMVNVVTMEGLDPENDIKAWGVDKDGNPVLDNKKVVWCGFHGSKTGQRYITNVFRDGCYARPNPKEEPYFIKGWEIIGKMCKCSPDVAKKEIDTLLQSGCRKIYVRKLSNLLGLENDHGFFDDVTIFSSQNFDRKQPDYNAIINKLLLPSLKSEWRIRTKELVAMLNSKKTKQLESEYGSEG